MDVWDWVFDKEYELRDAGHDRLADLVDKMPGYVMDNDHEQVDAHIDEAIQLARELKQPWVEIFVRHWRLQSKVLHRQESKEMLREAVELLEFSHRPEHIDCPQSVCVVQDLAACYGVTDGPGYFKERMQVYEETLNRITPQWSCFTCLSVECISALCDIGDYEGALKKLDDIDRELEQCGENDPSAELETKRTLALVRMKKFDQAHRALDKINFEHEDPVFQLSILAYRALILAHEGKLQEAMLTLPAHTDITQNCELHAIWIEVVNMHSQHDKAILTTENLSACKRMLNLAEQRGANRTTLLMGALVSRMFNRSGDPHSAQKALDTMKRIQPLLRGDHGAAAIIDKVATELSADQPSAGGL